MNLQFEEDENRADWIVAQTRLGEPTLNIIPLERQGDTVILPDGTKASIRAPAPIDTEKQLLKRQLRLSHQLVLGALLAENDTPVPLFGESALLKGHFPLWLSEGRKHLATEYGTFIAKLDPQLGLTIEKEAKKA